MGCHALSPFAGGALRRGQGLVAVAVRSPLYRACHNDPAALIAVTVVVLVLGNPVVLGWIWVLPRALKISYSRATYAAHACISV